MSATDSSACTRFRSTRGQSAEVGLDDALVAGLAPDGGLYVPCALPHFDAKALAHLPAELPALANALLAPLFASSRLRDALPGICAEAYAPGAPLVALHGENDFLLELFHGPSAAFKDFGARFLAECLSRLRDADAPATTILVATSGDTGAAVAAAFHQRPGFEVAILYPERRVSPRQAHGLECWGDNVQAFRVAGTFDDCQRMVKACLADAGLRQHHGLGSANSISLGRLLPQLAYHAHAVVAHWRAHGEVLNLIVPTGNLGNATAAWMARAMGLPIGEILLACNANRPLPDFMSGQPWQPSPTIATLANAMDVGDPSNFERMRAWLPEDAALRAAFRATGVSDARILETLRHARSRHGQIPCPHTACGLAALEDLRAAGDRRPWAVAATAHAAKFDTIVEPAVGESIPVPRALAAQLSRPAQALQLAADATALAAWLQRDRPAISAEKSHKIATMDTFQRGPGRPKDLKKRAAILEAAKTCFLRAGYPNVRMQEVADLAGVSKLTLYSHFGDKSGLFFAATEAHYQNNLPLDMILDWQGSDLRGALIRFGAAYRRHLMLPDSLRGRRMLQQSDVPESLPGSVWRVGHQSVVEQVEAKIADIGAMGLLAFADARLATLDLFTLLRGDLFGQLAFGVPREELEDEDPSAAYLEHAVDTFLRAYAPAHAPA